MAYEDEEAKGRAIGARARANKLSAERRAEIARKAAEERWSRPQVARKDRQELTTIEYREGREDPIVFGFDAGTQRIMATQEDMARLFDVSQPNISRHIKGVFAEGELDEESNMQKMHIAGSAKPVTFYSIDVVISVGYRVNSKLATRFRQWATQTLRTYLDQGYVINEKALRESPEKLNKLAAEVRALRSSEKQVYAKVRECFKISASDYEPGAAEVRKFYYLLQDKFHHAVTGMTSSKLILDRADHEVENLGLQTMAGQHPTLEDVQVGKNYLRYDELYRLHLLSEQFLLYAESTALARRKMTMKSLHEQLDRLLTLNEYSVFDGYKDFIRDEAMKHARQELELYRQRKKIEASGIRFNEEALAYGEYDDILEEVDA
ncbi:hypothetical protein J2T08_002984 [Neorhizobium galegae]|uniref:RhuM family protein n=1 Tax=Neorhizobium galegae TaxID=399 RepID=UPI0027875BD0|nr:RhuM family protein [Neorhizobium galegae]MDQ0135063.1 hypothetical protein [Neorhizobium galegae]